MAAVSSRMRVSAYPVEGRTIPPATPIAITRPAPRAKGAVVSRLCPPSARRIR
jgi:hypothetical protein